MAKKAEKYGKSEAHTRFLVALRGGLSTPATPLKSRKQMKRKAKASRTRT